MGSWIDPAHFMVLLLPDGLGNWLQTAGQHTQIFHARLTPPREVLLVQHDVGGIVYVKLIRRCEKMGAAGFGSSDAGLKVRVRGKLEGNHWRESGFVAGRAALIRHTCLEGRGRRKPKDLRTKGAVMREAMVSQPIFEAKKGGGVGHVLHKRPGQISAVHPRERDEAAPTRDAWPTSTETPRTTRMPDERRAARVARVTLRARCLGFCVPLQPAWRPRWNAARASAWQG